MKAWLEGYTPPRKPHHENEDAAVVMLSTSSSEVVLRQGGLGVMKIYVTKKERTHPANPSDPPPFPGAQRGGHQWVVVIISEGVRLPYSPNSPDYT